MKKIISIVMLLSLTTICCGYMYAEHKADEAYRSTLVTKKFVDRFHSGDTVDSILLGNYYNKRNEGIDYDEYKFNILHLKANRHLLDKNGYLKSVQVGEKITVICNVKVAQ